VLKDYEIRNPGVFDLGINYRYVNVKVLLTNSITLKKEREYWGKIGTQSSSIRLILKKSGVKSCYHYDCCFKTHLKVDNTST